MWYTRVCGGSTFWGVDLVAVVVVVVVAVVPVVRLPSLATDKV